MSGAPVLDQHASARATSNSFDHIDVGNDHLVVGVENALLVRGHGSIASLTYDHARFAMIVGHTLSVSSHVLDLLKGEFHDADWVWAIGEGINHSSSFSLVSDSIETNCNVFSM